MPCTLLCLWVVDTHSAIWSALTKRVYILHADGGTKSWFFGTQLVRAHLYTLCKPSTLLGYSTRLLNQFPSFCTSTLPSAHRADVSMYSHLLAATTLGA